MPTLTIHGTRGTMAVSGRAFNRFGGETTCLSLATRQGILIIDAGTGIITLGDQLMRRNILPPITIMFTHFHLDHVIGLPLFKPLYRQGASITFMADLRRQANWPDCLRALVVPPFWPMPLQRFGAAIRFQSLPRQNRRMRKYGVEIAWHSLRHPQQCLAYRLSTRKRSFVIATDHELDADNTDASFTDFCRGASVLIADAQYTPAEYAARRGWGHGTWSACARLAVKAGVGKLILTHHNRCRTDAQIDRLVRQAQRIFPATCAARCGMRVC
jgi:phosphoribosyl 1,2-cyclic phosphodiesterase